MSIERDSHAGASASQGRTVTTRVRLVLFGVAMLLVLWFLFAWLILDRHVLDAAGESVGTAFALGVVASLVGALRSSR